MLTKNPNVTELDISSTNLESLPQDIFKWKKITSLDIRNNPFTNFEEVAESLKNFPCLTDLKIDLTNQNQVLFIFDQVPRLKLLNGKSTKDAVTIVDIDESDIENITLQNDLPYLTEIVNKLNTENDQGFFDDFQAKLNEEAQKIKNCLNNNVPNYIYANVVIQSQFLIQKYLSEKLLGKLEGNNKEIAELLFNNIFQSASNLTELINNLYPKIEEKTENLRNQLDEAWKATEDLNDFEEKYLIVKKEREMLSNEKNLIQNKLERLETENKIMTEKLIKNAKDICGYTMGTKQNLTRENNLTTNNYQPQTTGNITHQNNNPSSSFGPRNASNVSNTNNNQTVGPTNAKILTIKMTKDIMNEIYNSKAIFDKKCFDNKLPRETMEQHMYTYLNQKYGLKNLIIEWASSIINAIKLYSSEDSDINLFGKILRNEQEEDSRLILTRLRATIEELLEYYLKSKSPLKSAKDIKAMLEQKKEGMLTEEEWKGIIYYIYSHEDAQNIENRINNFIQKNNKNNNKLLNENQLTTQNNQSNIPYTLTSANKKLTREEIYNLTRVKEDVSISYKDFIKLVSDHQIRSREKYLKNFVKLFRKFDQDSDGILNENEFIGLIKAIPYCKENIDDYTFKFLSIIDPFNNKKITFSECVSLFSMEMIEDQEGKNQSSLLDKICLDESS